MQAFVGYALWCNVAAMMATVVAGAVRRWRLAARLARAVVLASLVLLIMTVVAFIALPLATQASSMKAAILSRGISETVNCGVLAVVAAAPAAAVWALARSRR